MLTSEIIGPKGSGGPLETGHVICPACAHNFAAIPENARERIAELEAALRTAIDAVNGVGSVTVGDIHAAAAVLNKK